MTDIVKAHTIKPGSGMFDTRTCTRDCASRVNHTDYAARGALRAVALGRASAGQLRRQLFLQLDLVFPGRNPEARLTALDRDVPRFFAVDFEENGAGGEFTRDHSSVTCTPPGGCRHATRQ